jgi:3-oxoacyl-(acyl-carrier-protein) synthase
VVVSAGVANDVFVCGAGAVSPAGWGVAPLLDAIRSGTALPISELPRPQSIKPLRVRRVPAPSPRPPWLTHARLRRTSPITQYAIASALEALGDDAARVSRGELKLGIVLCVMSGCVNYSRRFYDEALRDPATASPLVFPETVFNAPSSHIAAFLNTNAVNYTLVGDPGTFLQGLALGADWLLGGAVDACLVVGAEEIDWITSDAFQLFSRDVVLSDGAGAVYLRRETCEGCVQLAAVTDSHLFVPSRTRAETIAQVRRQLAFNGSGTTLIDGLQDVRRYDAPERDVWGDWPAAQRLSPKKVLGEGLMAASAWQTILAVDAVRGGASAALVNVVGTNQQAIGAAFTGMRTSKSASR